MSGVLRRAYYVVHTFGFEFGVGMTTRRREKRDEGVTKARGDGSFDRLRMTPGGNDVASRGDSPSEGAAGAEVEDVVSGFHPVIGAWFRRRFAGPTDAQSAGWPEIRSGKDVLIAAPTGSGKTLAAFLCGIDALVRQAEAGELDEATTQIVYVSPLKALGNDIQRNLEAPLEELAAVAAEMGYAGGGHTGIRAYGQAAAGVDTALEAEAEGGSEPRPEGQGLAADGSFEGINVGSALTRMGEAGVWPEITVGLRTGDTPQKDRQAFIRRPPHILITTPESLYLMLTAQRSRETLRKVQTVIVDEIHALARDKRGSHLGLSLARLDHVCVSRPARIGLSATQRPVEEIAAFLVGTQAGEIKVAGQKTDALRVPQGERLSGDGQSGNRASRQGARKAVQAFEAERDSVPGPEGRGLAADGAAGEAWSAGRGVEPRPEGQSLTANEAPVHSVAQRPHPSPLPKGEGTGTRGEEVRGIGETAGSPPHPNPLPQGRGDELVKGERAPGCSIVDLGHQRDIELHVEVPPSDLEAVAPREQWADIYDRVAGLVRAHRTTLVFVNTRRLSERVAHHLRERLGEEAVASHHGSLSKERRLRVEQRLKAGDLQALVCTASLELGIDIGSIDLVCQIGSPRSVATFLQRVGRSGHALGLRPQGRLFPTSRDELIECAALIRAVKAGRLDRIVQPVAPLDILAQQIVAECACEDWAEDDLYDLVRRAWQYRDLSREDFDEVIEMLSEGVGEGAERAPPQIHRDRINRVVRGRRGSRMTAILNGGAIPEMADYKVVAEPDDMTVGTVNEDWAIESMAGDIFLLGSHSWRITRVGQGEVRVQDAQGLPPTIPFWLGEAPGRTVELSQEVGRLRQDVIDGLGIADGGVSGELRGDGSSLREDDGQSGNRAIGQAAAEADEAEGGDEAVDGDEAVGGAEPRPEGQSLTADEAPVHSVAQRSLPKGEGTRSEEVRGIGETAGRPPHPNPLPRGRGDKMVEREGTLTSESQALIGVSGGGESEPRPEGLGLGVEVASGGVGAVSRWMQDECGLDEIGALQIIDYLRAARDALGVLPTDRDVVFERFFDETGGMQLVVHAPFGARINRAWGLTLRKRFCVRFDFELQAAASDDSIVLSLGPQHSFPLEESFSYVTSRNAEASLKQAVLYAPVFPVRWRWDAGRALAVPRFTGARKVPPPIQRMRADDLLASVFPAQVGCQENVTGPLEIPDHPLVRQTVQDCLHEAMDLDGLVGVLERIEAGEIRLHAIDTLEPSPMAHEILSGKPYTYLDDAPLEERRTRAVTLRRALPENARELGALDQDAIDRVREEAWPLPRDAEEAHDALLSLVAVPVGDALEWSGWVDELVAAGRAGRVTSPPSPLSLRGEGESQLAGRQLWFAAENLELLRLLWPEGVVEPELDVPEAALVRVEDRDEARQRLIRGWTEAAGPVSASGLGARLGLRAEDVDRGLRQVESLGFVLRGRFSPGVEDDEFCDRRLLARIHRYTLDRLRREIDPVSQQDFMRFLLRWQHLTPDTKLAGKQGVRQAIARLEGFEAPAGAWERELLASRLSDYRSSWLDELCLQGDVAWARLTPRKVAAGKTTTASASRSTPVSLTLRGDMPALLMAVRHGQGNRAIGQSGKATGTRGEARGAGRGVEPRPEGEGLPAGGPKSGAAAEIHELLQSRGALFFDEIVNGVRRLRSDVERGLRELVAWGLVTADGFQGLRQLSGKAAHSGRRRSSESSYGGGAFFTGSGPAGRWALVPSFEAGEDDYDELAESAAKVLLQRYGVVMRDLYARESFSLPWRDVLRALRRLEARGTVRGGRFVTGPAGEQYALPEAVDALRRVRREERKEERVWVSAIDPLNLAGVLLPGGRVPAHAGNAVLYVDGLPQADEASSGVKTPVGTRLPRLEVGAR